MRYWPRLGIYVTRADAQAYISKVGGQHTYADDDLEEFVPAPSQNPEALTIEVEHLFENPPTEAPAPSAEILQMIAVIEFEEQRVPQAEMDVMVRDALGLPEETEQEIEYREKAAAIAAEREAQLAAESDAESEEE